MAKKRKRKDEDIKKIIKSAKAGISWKPGSNNDGIRKYKVSPRVLTIEGNTPLEIKQKLEWELEILEEDYPELFTKERAEAILNQFILRLYEKLISEFSKTDKSKNLQKDIFEPFMSWMKIVKDTAFEGFGSNRGKKIIYLLEMASNFKLEDLSKVKECIKNRKPLRDFLILKEYELVLKIVKSICKKKYRNPNAKFLDLKDKLRNFNYPEEIIRTVVSKKPSLITCELLASKYGKDKTTIHDLILKTRKADKLSKEIFDLT